MSLIKCENLSFAYSGETVLKDVSFSVSAGDYLCIVGENGSGKSTLMRGLLGLKEPSSGTISFGDGLRQNEIGYLPQQTDLQRDFPASVFEVALPGRLNSLGRRFFYSKADRAETERNLERIGMLEFKNRCYQELSGGQPQRGRLARPRNATRKQLVLPEPVAGLDPVATGEMYNILKLINLCDGVTVVMVSHDVNAALRYATHILQLGHTQLYFGSVHDYVHSDAAKILRGGETA